MRAVSRGIWEQEFPQKITPKGIKNIVIVAENHEESKDLADLYRDIEPEVRAFENLINEKLNPEAEGVH